MAEDAFQTARFEIYNPSRHKQAMLLFALRGYHRMAKHILECSLERPDLDERCLGRVDARGHAKPNGFATSKYVRELTPRGWNQAPFGTM